MSSQPTLAIESFFIENFRTFDVRTEIPLAGGPDGIVVFHGENGSGKSNALAALELFFRSALHWLRVGVPSNDSVRVAFDEVTPQVTIRRRDWPPAGPHKPMNLEVHFADPDLGQLRLQLQPSGTDVHLTLQCHRIHDSGTHQTREDPDKWFPVPSIERNAFRDRFETPHGAGSTSLYWLDARRRERTAKASAPVGLVTPDSPLSPAMVDRLYALKQSLQPLERARWRAFSALLGRFSGLGGQELDFAGPPGALSVTLERRLVQVLLHSELSSGEQQILGLCAAVLTSGASIVAIEEPDISLSPNSQAVLRTVIAEQVAAGLVDQVILESHVPSFDGPDVVRFERTPGGATTVARGPGAEDVSRRARAAYAEPQFVSRDGYTQLPRNMRAALNVEAGGDLWFLPDESGKHWRAWTTDELDAVLAAGTSGSEKK